MKIAFYYPGIFKIHEKKVYYKTHLNLEVATITDFSVESGGLCPFRKSGHPQVYLYVQNDETGMSKSVIYFEVLLYLIGILEFLSNFLQLFPSVNISWVSTPFSLCSSLFPKGFVGKIS